MVSNVVRRQRSQAALIGAARRLFAAQGYANTSTTEILSEAGLTRGALYHHYADKAALFEAVCRAVQSDAVAAIDRATKDKEGALAALRAGSSAWMRFMAAPEPRQILILDAPSVLGFDRWTALDREYGFARLREGVLAARDHLTPARTKTRAEDLAVLLNGMMNAAVMDSPDPKALRRMEKSVLSVIDALASA